MNEISGETNKKQGSVKFFKGLGEHLDPCFLPLGFESTSGPGVNYVREENGRIIKAHCSRRRRTRYAGEVRYYQYQGHQLEITVTTPLKSRLNIAEVKGAAMAFGSFTNRFAKVTKIDDMPQYESLAIWAAEEPWARQVLAETAVQRAIPPLLINENFSVAALRLTPNLWIYSLRTHVQEITPERVANWMDALTQIIDTAEQHPPLNEIEPTWIEEKMRNTNPYMLALIILGVPTLLLCSCGFFGLMVALALGGTG